MYLSLRMTFLQRQAGTATQAVSGQVFVGRVEQFERLFGQGYL